MAILKYRYETECDVLTGIKEKQLYPRPQKYLFHLLPRVILIIISAFTSVYHLNDTVRPPHSGLLLSAWNTSKAISGLSSLLARTGTLSGIDYSFREIYANLLDSPYLPSRALSPPLIRRDYSSFGLAPSPSRNPFSPLLAHVSSLVQTGTSVV